MRTSAIRHISVLVLASTFTIPPSAEAASMAADRSTIQDFLGGSGGVLVFAERGDSYKLKWVDLDDSALTIHTLSGDANCYDCQLSLDGARVYYRIGSTGYTRRLSGGGRVTIGSAGTGWWHVSGGVEYLVYNYDGAGKTYRQRMDGISPTGSRETIYGKSFSAGISGDGRWIGETYTTQRAYDLQSGKEYSGCFSGGNCSGSMSPDSSGRFLHLLGGHDQVRLWQYSSSQDTWNVLKEFGKPSGTGEWQRPRYAANDARYFTAVANDGGGYDLYLVRVADKAQLKLVSGDCWNSCLYVGSSTPPPANTPPDVSFQSPADGDSFDAPCDLAVVADASDADGSIVSVKLYLDGTLVRHEGIAPYEWGPPQGDAELTAMPAGSYALRLLAEDDDGATAEASIDITVSDAQAPNAPPQVEFLSPADGDTLDAPCDLEVLADASDADGSVVSVKLYLDGTLVRHEGIAPYEWGASQGDAELTAMPAGSYALRLLAEDDDGATAEATIGVTVIDVALPSITVLSPAAGDVWYAGTTRTIAWSVQNLDDCTIMYRTDPSDYWHVVESSVDSGDAAWLAYPWTVPDTPSDACQVIVTGYFGEAPAESGVFEINAVVDGDADGMDDGWEADHFGDLARDGTLDADGDGLTDYDEFMAGTDPGVASPPPPGDHNADEEAAYAFSCAPRRARATAARVVSTILLIFVVARYVARRRSRREHVRVG